MWRGSAVSHDVSARHFQLESGGQLGKGKAARRSIRWVSLVPWLLTADNMPDPQRLGIRLSVNEVRQAADTGQMIFGAGEVIRYLSQFIVLNPVTW